MHSLVCRFLTVAAAFGLAGCDGSSDGEITEAELHSHIQTLSSDEFEGRAPATEGETKTINYIAEAYRELGLKPVAGDNYFQAVPMVEITAQDISPLAFKSGERAYAVDYLDNMVVWSKRVVDRVELNDSEMVFVGYGINAPEYGWNDYEGIDVTGKTVVILVNDPGFATQNPDLFNGRNMTYYGRWTYKYEEAARQGAAAALVIHETEPAAYPWGVVQSSWAGPQLDLEREDKNMGRILVEGWISTAATHKLFEAAGQDYAALKNAAKETGFKAVPLNVTASVSFNNAIRTSESYNVAGLVEGRGSADEAILYMAHWDHLGRGPVVDGDDIYNGAVDNATGIAALLELAEKFARGKQPERSIVFLAVTGEESGLLGSAYYGENPLVPLPKTVAAINMDALNVIGPVRDMVVIGSGKSELENILSRHATAVNRVVVEEPTPEKGYYYRSDHFNLAKVGVPALYADGGMDHMEHGAEWGQQQADRYTAEDYHKPSDEYNPDWDLSGMVADINLLYAVGEDLANNGEWPNWFETAEFRATRDASLSQK